jgi:UDP-glucose 4-epimerase
MKILVTGISGKIGRLVAAELLARGHAIVGIDRRPWPNAPEGVEVVETDIRKRAAEDVFRTRRFDAAVHMATVTHIKKSSEDRFRINLGGTRAFFEHVHTYGVKRAVFVGRHTYYGAAPDSPLYHTEDEPPMALERFPELADLVAADLYAGSALWRFPDVTTSVLRVCYTLGPARHGTLADYLRGSRVPMVLGFDPLFQFMHEEDVARAIATALETSINGVFNVSGPPPLPLSTIVREAGRDAVPIPEPLLKLALGRFGLPELPPGAIDHIKYPVVIDSAAFEKATGFSHVFDEFATIAAFRAASPPLR